MFMKLAPRGVICAANTTQADTIKVPWTAVCDSFELKQATHFFPLCVFTHLGLSFHVGECRGNLCSKLSKNAS